MKANKSLILWGLLGFLVPPAGIILFFIWLRSKRTQAKATLFGALLMILLCSLSFAVQQITIPIFSSLNLI